MQLNNHTEISCDVFNFAIFMKNYIYQILALTNETKQFLAQMRYQKYLQLYIMYNNLITYISKVIFVCNFMIY